MLDPPIPPEALALVELIAGAIRAVLGAEIDAYPGHGSPERADPMTCAFHAIVVAILRKQCIDDLTVVSALLYRAEVRHLTVEGYDGDRVRRLIQEEPGSQ